jgi:PHD-finger/Phytanoyl-CoA dioxygenase (PhyH)
MFEDTTAAGVAALNLKLSKSNCLVCKDGDNEANTLICDECYDCYHIGCLRPPLKQVPSGEWYCAKCSVRSTLGTCWIPLGDTPVDHGVLAVLPGTQNLPNYYTPMNIQNSQVSKSYLSHAKNINWCTLNFEAGDVVVFDSHL